MASILRQIVLLVLVASAYATGPLILQDEPDARPWANPSSLQERQIASSGTRDLPTHVRPLHYKIELRPILDVGVFNTPGKVWITVECVESTNRITVHQRGIDMQESWVKHSETESEIPVVGQEENNAENEYTLILGDNLVPGQNYTVYFSFVSPIPDNYLGGLYRSSYVNPSTGQTHYLAATQFQSSDARRAFPCFDEPGTRSIFEISLARRETFHTLCNMEIVSTVPDPELTGWVWDHYQPTVWMPVYLIAIVVSDFDFVAAPADEMNGKLSKVWANPHLMATDAGIYGAVTSARAILAFEEIFQASYDLPKLDSGAIPDFSAGAMENWGLVLYRESLLLYVNGTNTEAERRSVSSVISHELAHQWFGNLVTCVTWDDLWLNEGFATYVSYLGMQATDPEYEPLDWIVPDSYQTGMLFDEGPTSQPIYSDVRPSRIVYQKAGSVIRMMNSFLTENTFIRGLQRYLARHAYQPVTQDQLFQALTEQGHEDGTLRPDFNMKTIMDTWTHQSGFPLLRVFRLSSTHISYTQEVYGPNPRKINTAILDPTHFWYVPVTLQHESLTTPALVWMTKTQTFQTYGPFDTNKLILINPGATGFYKVLYDDHLADLIVAQLAADKEVIPLTSRSQLIDDYFRFALGQPGYASVARAVDFTRYLATEASLFPWLAFLANMGTPFNYFQGHFSFNFFKDFYGPRIAGALRLIGEQQSATEKGASVILRSRLLDWDCAFSGSTCRTYSTELFQQFVATPTTNPVPADLRAVFYCAFVAHQSAEGLDFALAKFLETPTTPANNANDRTRWMNALGCATEEAQIARVLALTLDPASELTKSEQVVILQRVAMSREGRVALLTFLSERFDDIINFHNVNAIRNVIASLSQYVSTAEGRTEIEDLVDDHLDTLDPVMAAIRLSLNQITANTAWMDSYGRDFVAAFIEQ